MSLISVKRAIVLNFNQKLSSTFRIIFHDYWKLAVILNWLKLYFVLDIHCWYLDSERLDVGNVILLFIYFFLTESEFIDLKELLSFHCLHSCPPSPSANWSTGNLKGKNLCWRNRLFPVRHFDKLPFSVSNLFNSDNWHRVFYLVILFKTCNVIFL